MVRDPSVFDREELILMDSHRSTVILQQFLANPTNDEAFGKFAGKYQPRIKRCCQARGLQDADADDLTAALLLRFFERDVFADFVFQTKEKFYAWLRTVVTRAVLTFLRSRGRRPEAWSVGNAEAQESLDWVTEEMVRELGCVRDEERALLATVRPRVEQRLEEKTRQAFRMLVDEGHTPDEVAQLLGMSKFAVWKARSRVLRLLRQEFPHLPSPVGESDREATA
jgi:RNA polymerase sigma factor (sigma-70 family)